MADINGLVWLFNISIIVFLNFLCLNLKIGQNYVKSGAKETFKE